MLKNIWILFLLIFLSFVGLFFVLSKGIYVDKISFSSINISQLYIKLDKKLIVRAKELKIPSIKRQKTTYDNSNTYIQYIPWILTVFEDVEIDLLEIQDNKINVKINKSIFHIENNSINITAKPIVRGDIVELELYSLYSKKYDLNFEGLLWTNLKTDEIGFDGKAAYKDVVVSLYTETDKETIAFELKSSNSLSSIKFVKDFVKLHPIIEEWMYDNVLGDYSLDYLKGKLNKSTFMPILSTFEGLAVVKNAKIRFHKDLDYVNTPLIKVAFKEDNLYFDLEKPSYKHIDINGSKVSIYSLSSKEKSSYISINIKTKHYLSQEILDLLKAYEVDLPIIQLDGATNSDLKINIDFKSNKLTTKGIFEAKNSNFSLNGSEFLAKNALVVLDNKKVKIQNSQVEIKDFLKGMLNLEIDTSTKSAKGNAKLTYLNINNNNKEILKINDFLTNIEVDYNSFVKIAFPQLYTNLQVFESYTDIEINNLNFAKTYSKLLQDLNIEDGSLSLDFYNKDKIELVANIKSSKFPFLRKNGEKIEQMDIYGKILKNNATVMSNDGNLKVEIKNDKNSIWINDIDLLSSSSNNGNKEQTHIDLKVNGINSSIILDDTKKLLSDNYNLVYKNGDANLDLFYNMGVLTYTKNKNKINFSAKNMSDKFINNVLGIKELFKDGVFQLEAKSTSDQLINGHLVVKKSKIEDLAIVSNLVAFINASPAIINPLLAIPSAIGAISNGGFDLASYEIVEGIVDFTYDELEKFFYIDNLNTTGNSVDFEAIGSIDLISNEIYSDVSIAFLKNYSKIVNLIPVVNYLVLGENGNLTTNVKIHGSLSDPKIETQLASDIAGGSVNFLKRIINLPVKGIDLLNQKKEE